MKVRLAVIGLDLIQQDWLEAVRLLAERKVVEVVAAGHRSQSLAKGLGDALAVTAFDDLRKLILEARPQVILLDRPTDLPTEFLISALAAGVGVFSVGPPVFSVAEAQALAEIIEPRTTMIYVSPRLAGTAAYRHCAQADEFVQPIRFASAQWYGMNHALAKSSGQTEDTVRSLSVLAWDVLATLIELMGMPESVYATLRGTGGGPTHFADISGAAALTLRFAEQGLASVGLSDKLGPSRRELVLLGQAGALRLDQSRYEFSDQEGKLIDSGQVTPASGAARAADELSEFLTQFLAPPSPHRGWAHRLEEVAATMEAMVVSHRTGQAEEPERFLALRR